MGSGCSAYPHAADNIHCDEDQSTIIRTPLAVSVAAVGAPSETVSVALDGAVVTHPIPPNSVLIATSHQRQVIHPSTMTVHMVPHYSIIDRPLLFGAAHHEGGDVHPCPFPTSSGVSALKAAASTSTVDELAASEDTGSIHTACYPSVTVAMHHHASMPLDSRVRLLAPQSRGTMLLAQPQRPSVHSTGTISSSVHSSTTSSPPHIGGSGATLPMLPGGGTTASSTRASFDTSAMDMTCNVAAFVDMLSDAFGDEATPGDHSTYQRPPPPPRSSPPHTHHGCTGETQQGHGNEASSRGGSSSSTTPPASTPSARMLFASTMFTSAAMPVTTANSPPFPPNTVVQPPPPRTTSTPTPNHTQTTAPDLSQTTLSMSAVGRSTRTGSESRNSTSDDNSVVRLLRQLPSTSNPNAAPGTTTRGSTSTSTGLPLGGSSSSGHATPSTPTSTPLQGGDPQPPLSSSSLRHRRSSPRPAGFPPSMSSMSAGAAADATFQVNTPRSGGAGSSISSRAERSTASANLSVDQNPSFLPVTVKRSNNSGLVSLRGITFQSVLESKDKDDATPPNGSPLTTITTRTTSSQSTVTMKLLPDIVVRGPSSNAISSQTSQRVPYRSQPQSLPPARHPFPPTHSPMTPSNMQQWSRVVASSQKGLEDEDGGESGAWPLGGTRITSEGDGAGPGSSAGSLMQVSQTLAFLDDFGPQLMSARTDEE